MTVHKIDSLYKAFPWQVVASERFIDKTVEHDEGKTRKMGVQKKYIFTSPMFKGDIIADTMHNRLSSITDKNFYGIKLQLRSISKPILCLRLKDKLVEVLKLPWPRSSM